ncbi:MAG: hypothetical protein CSA63_00625 [Propionibacterium sp.]|nr:MAG: hypothetical protein CSA63_00625 [Propionibacterium sp.]
MAGDAKERRVALAILFSGSAAALASLFGDPWRQVDAANAELSTLRGNAVLLRSEVAVRQARIKQLEAAIVQLESQLTEQTGRTTQNLVSLPKRGQVLSGDDVREAVATPVTITRYHA